jgi:hypothetical protein
MHNDTCIQPGYFDEIEKFVREQVYSEARRKGRTLSDKDEEKDEKQSFSATSSFSYKSR